MHTQHDWFTIGSPTVVDIPGKHRKFEGFSKYLCLQTLRRALPLDIHIVLSDINHIYWTIFGFTIFSHVSESIFVEIFVIIEGKQWYCISTTVGLPIVNQA